MPDRLSAYRDCPRCRHINRPLARFCAQCGRGLGGRSAVRGGQRPAPPRNLQGAPCFGLLIAGLVAAALATGGIGRTSGRGWALSKSSQTGLVTSDLRLAHLQADAVYQLLAPDDVKVLVGRRDGGIFVKGTRVEIQTLRRFAELISRFNGYNHVRLRQTMRRAESTWTSRRTYKLPADRAGPLFHILAMDDVPVRVHGSQNGVIVDAAPRDQDTLADLVGILRGQR